MGVVSGTLEEDEMVHAVGIAVESESIVDMDMSSLWCKCKVKWFGKYRLGMGQLGTTSLDFSESVDGSVLTAVPIDSSIEKLSFSSWMAVRSVVVKFSRLTVS